jgi:hypothetical protein
MSDEAVKKKENIIPLAAKVGYGNGDIHIADVRAMLEGRITSAGPCPAVKLSSILGCEADMFP